MCCLNGSRKLLTQKILQIRIVGIRMDFPHEVRFSAGIGPAHFPAETTRPLGPRLSAIFTFFMNNSQIRNKSNRDPDGFSGEAFFFL